MIVAGHSVHRRDKIFRSAGLFSGETQGHFDDDEHIVIAVWAAVVASQFLSAGMGRRICGDGIRADRR